MSAVGSVLEARKMALRIVVWFFLHILRLVQWWVRVSGLNGQRGGVSNILR